ncbi:MAG: pyruvate formate lyase family protein [Anaerocolumna sp.]
MKEIVNLELDGTSIDPKIIQAVEITKAYIQYEEAPLPIREAMCLKKQFPLLLKEIQTQDLFAGRIPRDRILYVGTIWWGAYEKKLEGQYLEGKQGGFCFDFSAVEKDCYTKTEKDILKKLSEFWKDKATILLENHSRDEELMKYVGDDCQVGSENIGFSIALDLDKLVQLGIPGLLEEVDQRQDKLAQKGEDTSFYEGLHMVLEIAIEACHYYELQASTFATKAEDDKDKKRLFDMAEALGAIKANPPKSFREAVQLIWIYTILSGGKHLEAYGLDVALGDLFVHDIDLGILSEEEGVLMLQSLWRLYNENGEDATCRIMLGGKGRRNEENANCFSYIAMEATARHKRVTPQLTLRFYEGLEEGLLKKAYDTINESYTFPLLYNDEVIIPGVAQAFGISEKIAERYHPLGCGEYMIANSSPSLLDCVWNIPKALEAALRNGYSSKGKLIGPKTGTNDNFDTFDKLYAAFEIQIKFAAHLVAKAYENICHTLKKNGAFLFASLLTDDCIKRGKPIMDGGVRYLGGCVMGHGYSNAADALTAIKKLVYEEKRFTLDQLVNILDSDFQGFENVRRLLLNAPKYGNDMEEADEMHGVMWKLIHSAIREAGDTSELDFLIASSVNPGGHGMGFLTDATADGRRKGQAFAIGNSPTAGVDQKGLTALLNSLAKTDPVNGGAVSNIKISREFFTQERDKLEALFGTFFAKGGMQANVCVVNKGDLEAAIKEPEKYAHVLVRVGGWSARFVDLDPKVQEEIIERTLY